MNFVFCQTKFYMFYLSYMWTMVINCSFDINKLIFLIKFIFKMSRWMSILNLDVVP